jgi:Raf kinase inhibitor-like YbhB/YbcL family protein
MRRTTFLTLLFAVMIRPAIAQRGRGGGGAGGRGGGIATMDLTTAAWPDGGTIPTKYTQAGDQVSPALSWSGVPEGTQSFVLVFHDVDSAAGNGTDDVLQWLLWNIPAQATKLPEGVPEGAQLTDGTRQVSVTGPNYRGPGAPAAGPAHHYVFELFALDTMLNVQTAAQVSGVSPGVETRAAVVRAMAGHVRGKAVYVGLFRR